jgi:hypothetical protein
MSQLGFPEAQSSQSGRYAGLAMPTSYPGTASFAIRLAKTERGRLDASRLPGDLSGSIVRIADHLETIPKPLRGQAVSKPSQAFHICG